MHSDDRVSSQAAQTYKSDSLYFVWNFGSEQFIRFCMGILTDISKW